LKTLDLEEIIVYAGRFHKFNVEEPEEYRWIDLQDVKGLEDPRFSKYKSEGLRKSLVNAETHALEMRKSSKKRPTIKLTITVSERI
jgi:hypothetical protein